MANITSDKVILLDKLYNLRGDESIITSNIEEEIDNLNNRISDTIEEKNNEVQTKISLENQLDIFTSQSSMFLENFSAYDNSSFESLKEVDVDIELGTILAKLRQNVPTHKDEIRNDIASSENRISEYATNIEELNRELTKSKIELEDAEEVKTRLNSLLNDIILNSNDSYNRAYVRKVLDELNIFSDEEKTSLEYLILFPENGLAEFDASYNTKEHKNPFIEERVNNSIIEEKQEVQEKKAEPISIIDLPKDEPKIIIEEAKPIIEEPKSIVTEPIVEHKPIIEESKKDINAPEPKEEKTYSSDELTKNTQEEPSGPLIEPIQEPEINIVISEEKTDSIAQETVQKEPYEDLKKDLEKLNIDYTKIKKEDYESAMYLLSNTEHGVLALNAELLKSIEVPESIIYKYIAPYNYMYLADSELSKKISLIRSKGINDYKIKEEFIRSNFTYSLSVMKDRIEALKTTGNELSEKNISDLKSDIIGFYKNILTLSDLGFELDDKEIRNYKAVLENSPYIALDAKLLKDHLIKLVQKNGKYSMNVFWKSPKELTLDIEELEEAGLSNLMEQNPEVLATNCENVIRRTNYCLENNMPINENDDESEYCSYVVNPLEFYRTFENVSLPSIPSKKENNDLIAKLATNQDYVKLLLESLNKYYQEPENLHDIDFNDKELEITYKELINRVGSIISATNETDKLYEVADVNLSKSKIYRNLRVVLNSLAEQNQPVTGLEREIILACALYNTKIPKEKIHTIAKNCLGNIKSFNELGGLAA